MVSEDQLPDEVQADLGRIGARISRVGSVFLFIGGVALLVLAAMFPIGYFVIFELSDFGPRFWIMCLGTAGTLGFGASLIYRSFTEKAKDHRPWLDGVAREAYRKTREDLRKQGLLKEEDE